jgi:hypothetical protein
MRPTTEFLRVLVGIKRRGPSHEREYKGFLEYQYNFFLKKLLNTNDPNEKFKYSGKVEQLEQELKWFEEAENILLARKQ